MPILITARAEWISAFHAGIWGSTAARSAGWPATAIPVRLVYYCAGCVLQPQLFAAILQTAAVDLIGIDVLDRPIVCAFEEEVATRGNDAGEVNKGRAIAGRRECPSGEVNSVIGVVLQFDPLVTGAGGCPGPGNLVDHHVKGTGICRRIGGGENGSACLC